MASPGELIDVVAQVTGVARARVFSAHRYLRESGLITIGGRGTSAARMTARDAAHLLIAVSTANEVKDSPVLVKHPGGLRSRPGGWSLDFLPLKELIELPPDHAFADAVEALIRSAVSGSMQEASDAVGGGDLLHDISPFVNIEVTVRGPIPSGTVLAEVFDKDENGAPERNKDATEIHRYDSRRTKPDASIIAQIYIPNAAEMSFDLRSEFTFTHKTIMAVGNLLRGDDPDQ